MEEPIERRKDGWTWTKEIMGTIIGVVTVLALPSAWFLSWSRDVDRDRALHSTEINHLKETRLAIEKKTDSTDAKLDKILEQMTELKVQMATKK